MDTKFKKRFRTLMGIDYVFALIVNASNKVISYNTMAGSLAVDAGKSVTKQALHKVMTKKSFLKFFEQIFNDVLLKKILSDSKNIQHRFKRVLIQDSTIIKLPNRLFAEFSGVKNGFTQVANARIQFALNILLNNCIHFFLDSYSVNDIASKAFAIQEGDLVLRDRGYFSVPEIMRILKAKAHFIYRYKHGITYLDSTTGKKIDFLKRLHKSKVTDIKVRLLNADGPIVRLIAIPINIELANQRRAQLKKQASYIPQKEVLALLSWSIFITSIEDEDINYDVIFKLYKLRWRIEILFKAMKSHLNLDSIHNVSKTQLEFSILSKLLLMMILLQFIYEPLAKPVREFYKKDISILKLTNFLMNNKEYIADLVALTLKPPIKDEPLLVLLAKYTTYDKRKKRENYQEYLSGCFSLS